MTDVLSEMKDIKLHMKNISQHTNTNKKEEKIVSILSRNELHFPLESEEDLQALELILQDNNEMNNAVMEIYF